MGNGGSNGGLHNRDQGADSQMIDVIIGRDDGDDYSVISVKDKESGNIMLNIQVPDSALISQTYKLGGGVKPLVAMHSLCNSSFYAILTSFRAVLEEMEMGDDESDKD